MKFIVKVKTCKEGTIHTLIIICRSLENSANFAIFPRGDVKCALTKEMLSLNLLLRLLGLGYLVMLGVNNNFNEGYIYSLIWEISQRFVIKNAMICHSLRHTFRLRLFSRYQYRQIALVDFENGGHVIAGVSSTKGGNEHV
ncbi:hypothetical protein [Dictyobacter halimunensis]|uniref:hypothetical protein n=1 Tax=Dictyobacter halimunensis TaxID=3026934 RepID=UPI0030C7790D